MDINEAKQKLQLTEEEIKAAQDYFGSEHTSINLLGDLDPKAFCKLRKTGWLLAKNREDLQNKIKIFTDLYSLMYKDSAETTRMGGLAHGTSITRAKALNGTNKQFLSTSMNEDISKRFCEYGNPAIVRIYIDADVPRLYSENFTTSVVNEEEEEVIIAPFCQIKSNKFVSKWDGYEFYSVSIEKGELQEKSQQEIESLTTKVLDGYEQNIADMEEYTWLLNRIEFLQDKLNITKDMEERKDISQDLKQTRNDFDTIWKRTSEYKNNLTSLLQGMCREKEKEIDEAREIVKKDFEQKRREFEAQKKEEQRVAAINELKQKIDMTVQKTGVINERIAEEYKELLEKESAYRELAKEFGVELAGSVESELELDIINISSLVKAEEKRMQEVEILENSTLEETEKQSDEYAGTIEKIDASMEIADALKEITELYGIESEDIIKKDIYLRMNSLMSNTRMSLLQQQMTNIQNQKRGVFDGITGKAKARELQLQNIDLKMKLTAKTSPQLKNYYSVYDMLAEIYAFSQTELGGKYTPELENLFTTMQTRFKGDDGKTISLEQIQKFAQPKISKYQQENLPTVPRKKFRLFGKTKDEIEYLQVQNSQIQTEINSADAYNLRNQIQQPERTATDVFKKRLKDIAHNINYKEEQTITQAKVQEDTMELWGK